MSECGSRSRSPRGRHLSTGENGSVPAPREGFCWESCGFSLSTKDTMMVLATCKDGGAWGSFEVKKYGPLELEPSATILNYGQGLFEGIKAYRTPSDRIVLFRPGANAKRQAYGAARLLMPPVPMDLFLAMCGAAVRANADWVPPAGVGALYLRPVMFGSGASLGVAPSHEYTFVIFVAPVSQYFKGGGARMRVELDHQRASPLGVGHVKFAGNYAPCFAAQKHAKADGFSDVIYLDVDGQYIEEAAASNFFCVGEDGILRTPGLGSILPGVTRDTVLKLAERLKSADSFALHDVQVGKVSLPQVLNSTECFVTGTGAGISPLAHIASQSHSVDFPSPGPVTKLLQDSLKEIQLGKVPESADWLWDVFKESDADAAARFAKIEQSFL